MLSTLGVGVIDKGVRADLVWPDGEAKLVLSV